MHDLEKVNRLPPGDWLTLLRAWWNLFYYFFALQVTSYDRLARSSSSTIKTRSGPPEPFGSAQRVHRLVVSATRLHFLPLTCLHRSLAAIRILHGQKIEPALRIGVLKTGHHIYAHAWIEVDGLPVGEDPVDLSQFSRLEPAQNQRIDKFM